MAVKNSINKEIHINHNVVMEILRSSNFATLIEAEYIEEAKTATCIEFRYVRKMSLSDHSRNFFIGVSPVDDETTMITITTQSRKPTVLFDTGWQAKVDRVAKVLEILLESKL